MEIDIRQLTKDYALDDLQHYTLLIILRINRGHETGCLSDKRISKEELVEWLERLYGIKTSERAVRKAIAEMISMGVPIAATSRKKGYYLASKTELQVSIKEIESRLHKLWQRKKGAERAIQIFYNENYEQVGITEWRDSKSKV